MCVIECLHGKVNGEEEKDDEEAFTFTPEAGQLVNKDSGRMMESSQLANHRPLWIIFRVVLSTFKPTKCFFAPWKYVERFLNFWFPINFLF